MMPLPHRLPRSEIGWQVPPWATRAEPPRDAFQYQTMVTESVAPLALIRWHHRFDSRPELIRNHTHSRHRSIVAGQRLPIRETRPSYWLHWDGTRTPRISTTDRPDPLAREAGPQGEPSVQPQHPDRPTPAKHSSTAAAEPPGSKNSGSRAEALWAIAVALERLADVIVGALNPAETTGRHAAGRDKCS